MDSHNGGQYTPEAMEVTIARLQTENTSLTEKLAHAIAFSDENIERLTKLHGEALTQVEEVEELLVASQTLISDHMANTEGPLDQRDKALARVTELEKGLRAIVASCENCTNASDLRDMAWRILHGTDFIDHVPCDLEQRIEDIKAVLWMIPLSTQTAEVQVEIQAARRGRRP